MKAQTPLPIPDTLSGAVIDLTMQAGTAEFHPGEVVDTYGYNGDLLGPTIVLQSGQDVTLNVTNTLPDLTTTHGHGLHVSAANDGGPHSLIYPNTTWSPSFTVLERRPMRWASTRRGCCSSAWSITSSTSRLVALTAIRPGWRPSFKETLLRQLDGLDRVEAGSLVEARYRRLRGYGSHKVE